MVFCYSRSNVGVFAVGAVDDHAVWRGSLVDIRVATLEIVILWATRFRNGQLWLKTSRFMSINYLRAVFPLRI